MSLFLTLFPPFILALLAYFPTTNHSFVWDDTDVIVENPSAHELSDLSTTLRQGYGWAPTENVGRDAMIYFRPVVTSINTVTWVLASGKPWVFHLENLLLHACTAALLSLLLLWMGIAPGGALLVGSLFAVHPAHSEAVAWISGRADLLVGFFSMITLVLLLGWRQDRWKGWFAGIAPWLGATATFLALGSKELAFVLIVFVPLMLRLPDVPRTETEGAGPIQSQARLRLRPVRVGIWILLGSSVVLSLLYRGIVLGSENVLAGVQHSGGTGLSYRLLLSGNLFFTYLQRIVIPYPLSLAPPSSLVGRNPPVLTGVLGFLILVGALLIWVCFTVHLLRRRSLDLSLLRIRGTSTTILGLGLFLLGLLPVLQWIPTGEVYGERFLYLPMIGLLIFFSGLVDRWLGHRMLRAWCLLLLLGIPYLILLEMRLPDWRDEVTLFASEVRARPQNARALANLGSALAARGQLREGVEYVSQAVRIDPTDPKNRAVLGSLLVNVGQFEDGAEELEFAYHNGMRSKTTLKNLGIAWTRVGEYEQAVEVLTQAMALDPIDPTLPDALGMAERRRGRWDEAARLFHRSIELDPTRKGAWLNLIYMLYMEKRDTEEARVWAERFLQRFPGVPEAEIVRKMLGGELPQL